MIVSVVGDGTLVAGTIVAGASSTGTNAESGMPVGRAG